MKQKMDAGFFLRGVVSGVFLAAFAGVGNAAPVTWDGSLPSAGNPLTSQQYQDFTIYSLNYLSNLAAKQPLLLPSPTYNVDSSPGKIQGYVVLATNGPPAETNTDTCGATGCDQAYNSQVLGSSHPTYFQSSSETEPSVVVPGEPTRSTWTAQASALRTYLTGSNAMTFMFNLNEDNGGDVNTLDGQSLLVSMRVQLTDAGGGVLHTFYIGANNAIGLAQTAADVWGVLGAPDPTPVVANATVLNTGTANGYISTDARWAYVHGAISVDSSTGEFMAMGDCASTGLANCQTINQNLGANEVAFSAFNQQLSDLILDPLSGIAFMNVDFTTAGQSNGYEQLFIAGVNIPTNRAPEPGSLALVGMALAGLCVGVRCRRGLSSK